MLAAAEHQARCDGVTERPQNLVSIGYGMAALRIGNHVAEDTPLLRAIVPMTVGRQLQRFSRYCLSNTQSYSNHEWSLNRVNRQ